MSDTPYTVGRGRPPKASQLKKGQSGNPSGRKRRTPSMIEAVDAELDAVKIVTEGGKKKRMTLRQMQAKRIAAKLASADMRMLIWFNEQLRLAGLAEKPEPQLIRFTMKME